MSYTPYRRYRTTRRAGSSSFKLFAAVLFSFLACVFLLFLVSQFWAKMKASKQDDVVVTLLEGKATMLMAGGPEQAVGLTQFMYEGDSLQSLPGGRVRLEFPGGAELTLDEQSRLQYQHFVSEEGVHRFELELVEGRLWFYQKLSPMNVEIESIQIRGGLFQALSNQSEYLMEIGADEDRLVVWDGEIQLRYVDPDSLQEIDALRLVKGDMTRFDLEKRALFLSRRPLSLLETFRPEDILNMEFVRFVKNPQDRGSLPVSKTLPEDEAVEMEELESPVKEDPVSQEPSLSITNLRSGLRLTKPAQALEGLIQNPENIVAVEVAWSGSGIFYPLSLYVPGASSFRYVADVQYGNLAVGQNTYRLRAKKADGSYTPEVTIRLELPEGL